MRHPKYYQIKTKTFVAGIGISLDSVVVAAPIVGYMFGWSYARVSDYCKEKGWGLTDIDALIHEHSTRKPASETARGDAD